MIEDVPPYYVTSILCHSKFILSIIFMSYVCDIVGPFPPPNSPGTLQTMHDAMVANRIETVDYFRSTQNYRLNTLITLRLSLCRTELFTVASILLHFVSCTKTNCLETLRDWSGSVQTLQDHSFGTKVSW